MSIGVSTISGAFLGFFDLVVPTVSSNELLRELLREGRPGRFLVATFAFEMSALDRFDIVRLLI